MKSISVIGLGAMGHALAGALLAKQFKVTVWNRTAEKAEELVASGADRADTLAEAISASDVIVICISDYAGTYALLDQSGVADLLSNRTVIQLSTGTPSDAREMGQWVNALGGGYIDGAIECYPPNIGSASSQILVAGDSALVTSVQPVLNALGEDIRYLGDEIGAAAALDMAVVSRLIAITPAVIHGALICESEGVSLQQFADMFAEGDRARSVVLSIHNNEFEDNVTASVNVAIDVATSIKRQAQSKQINSEFPDHILGLYERAVAAGQRHHDTSSLIRVLRQ